MNLQFFQTFSGWRYTYPSEKYEFVNGKDDIPYMMESHKIHVPNHQPVFKSNETILDMLTVRPCWLVQLWVNSGPWDNHGAINDHIFGTIRRGWSDYTPMGFARSFSVQRLIYVPLDPIYLTVNPWYWDNELQWDGGWWFVDNAEFIPLYHYPLDLSMQILYIPFYPHSVPIYSPLCHIHVISLNPVKSATKSHVIRWNLNKSHGNLLWIALNHHKFLWHHHATTILWVVSAVSVMLTVSPSPP